jgi:hypothetical protein
MTANLLSWSPLVGPALAAFVAIVGYALTHSLASRRDLRNEKRTIRINFMIDAYRRLEDGSCRGDDQEKYSDAFHSAIADIQLLGSPAQVEIAQKIAFAIGSGTGIPIPINDLLNALREELRSELDLPRLGIDIVILRSPGQIIQH